MNDSSTGARTSAILDRAGEPSELIATARAFGKLEKAIHQALPDARPLRVACVRGTELVVAADSPVWATRARMLTAELLETASAAWHQPLDSVRIIVAPPLDAAARRD